MVDSFEKADDSTIVMTTKYPFSFLPWLLTRVLMVSPTQWEKVGKSWAEFAKKPAGTGPFKITNVVPGQYAEMARNEAYWDKERIPKIDKMIVYPMPEATTRVAALRSGQVDWIEVPAPDSLPSLKQAGFQSSSLAVSAHLSVRAELHGRLAIPRRAGASGDQLRARPRGTVQADQRHRANQPSACIRPTIRFSARRPSTTATIRTRRRRC